MSTHAAVIVKIRDDKFKGIYSHSDGYGLLPFLKKMCPTKDKAEALVELGACSQIWGCERFAPIGEHSYDSPEEGTVIAYHRDRKEDLDIVEGPNMEDVANDIDHSGYVYLFADGQWEVYIPTQHGEYQVSPDLDKMGKEIPMTDKDWENIKAKEAAEAKVKHITNEEFWKQATQTQRAGWLIGLFGHRANSTTFNHSKHEWLDLPKYVRGTSKGIFDEKVIPTPYK